VNRPADFVAAKRLIADRVAVDDNRLHDPAVPLKSL
jgi:hypothetical protein